jgi:uncharacterized protein
MPGLKDKVVLITGASSGFGEDAARLFAGEGCKVVLAARRLDRLQSLAEQIRQQGGEALAVGLDITQQTEIEALLRVVLEKYGRVDILFNNAGLAHHGWLEALDPGGDIEPPVEVNLLGLIQVTRAVLPHMLARRQGHIINMASVAGWIAVPAYSVYAATKFGVRGFTTALRRELAPQGIQVSGIYPAFADTEFSSQSWGAARRPRMGFLRRLAMSSEYVARQVVRTAKRPRRAVILPWWYGTIICIEVLFPGLVDLFIRLTFTKRLPNS